MLNNKNIMVIKILDLGIERYLVSFVVRDFFVGFVVVICWGLERYIVEIFNIYYIGDIGKIIILENFKIF